MFEFLLSSSSVSTRHSLMTSFLNSVTNILGDVNVGHTGTEAVGCRTQETGLETPCGFAFPRYNSIWQHMNEQNSHQ